MKEERNLILVAAAVGGTSAIFHLVHHRMSGDFEEDVPLVIGQGLLYAAPLFLGVLSGLFSAKPVRTSLLLVLVTLLTAAPLLLEDLLCLILIAPICVVVAPLVAFVTGRFAGRGRCPPGGSSTGLGALLLALPFVLAVDARLRPPLLPGPVELVDQVVVPRPRDRVWRSLALLQLDFEDHAPVLVRAFLPAPRAVIGGGVDVGAERRVVFSNGVAVGTVVASSPPARFAFRIDVEPGARGFFDHWVRLEDSVIELTELGPDRTRVVHRTSYRPLALPRWYFEPAEKYLGSVVQRALLDAYAESLAREPERSTAARVAAR